MRKIESIPPSEYYLWRKKTETFYPWQRQYVNCEFLKYEQKRIEKFLEWYTKFRKADENKEVDSASFYAVPLELSSSWKAAIVSHGNYNYVGLSALFNSPQGSLIALVPYSIEKPYDYRLIEITKSKKTNLINEKLNKVEYALIIEDWDYLKSDNVYVDVDYEKKVVAKILEENLGVDNQFSLSFQSPIISAPYDGSIGGITLSSIFSNSSFAKELLKTIQLMVPPEYRTLMPSKTLYKGDKFQCRNGIKFHLAERPYFDRNVLSSVYVRKYSEIDRELLQRENFNGEFSIFSTLNPYRGRLEALKEMFKKYTATEITLSKSLDELLEADVYLKRLKNAINEDLWIQIAYSRQYMPGIDKNVEKEFFKITQFLKKDLDILLPDIYRDEKSKEHWVNSLLYPLTDNMNRIAQSLARADEKDKLNEKYLKKARGIIIDNFKGFIDLPEIQDTLSSLTKRKSKGGPRYSIVQTELINHPQSTVKEIFEAVKSTGVFTDIYDLQEFLDWLHRKGYVIVDGNRKYTWAGALSS